MKEAYLIHGTSTRDDDWFPWLEKAARPAIELDRLWLPDPFAPQQAAWNHWLLIPQSVHISFHQTCS